MSESSLDELVQHYQTAIDTLKTQGTATPEAQVLSLLLLRDQVQRYLQTPTETQGTMMLQVQHLDHDFQDQGVLIASHYPLQTWRSMIDPPVAHWWWYFEVPEDINVWDRYDWLWQALSFPVIAANASLVATMSSIFLSGGLDAVGSFAMIGQGALTVASASGAVTEGGKEFLQKILTSLRIPSHFWAELQLVTSLVLFLGLTQFHRNLPQLANYYITQGNSPNLTATQRLDKFQRAIRIDESNMEAHFLVGLIYEDLLDFTQAEAEYRIAVLGDYTPAYSALARRYILKGKNAEAITLLKQGYFMTEEDLVAAYVLKNWGWARFNQGKQNPGLYREAQTRLEESIDTYQTVYQAEVAAVGVENVTLPAELGASHCLLAQVLEAQKKEAIAHWRDCLSFADGSIPEEDQWSEIASQRLEAYRQSHPNVNFDNLTAPLETIPDAGTVEGN